MQLRRATVQVITPLPAPGRLRTAVIKLLLALKPLPSMTLHLQRSYVRQLLPWPVMETTLQPPRALPPQRITAAESHPSLTPTARRRQATVQAATASSGPGKRQTAAAITAPAIKRLM